MKNVNLLTLAKVLADEHAMMQQRLAPAIF